MQRREDSAEAYLTSRKGAHPYALGGLLRCGDCGGTLGGQLRANKREPFYMCRTYLQAGSAACWHNSIPEAPLVATIVDKIREEYFSPTARDRIRKAIEKEQTETASKPAGTIRLRREIDSLDAKIERGAERVLDAPDDLVPAVYRKLEELKRERDRLKAELGVLSQRKTRSRPEADREVEQAMHALDELQGTLDGAEPAELRELLREFVSEIVLRFEHETRGKRRTARFVDGEVLLRPQTSHMNTSCP